MNKVIEMGNLVADPELKQTQSGTAIATFTIAVNRRFKDTNGNYITDFFNCVAWKGTAEHICKYFRKGKRILIMGELQNRSYEAQDGSKRTVTEINVAEAHFCGSKAETTAPTETTAPYAYAYAADASGDFEEMATDEDLPF